MAPGKYAHVIIDSNTFMCIYMTYLARCGTQPAILYNQLFALCAMLKLFPMEDNLGKFSPRLDENFRWDEKKSFQ